MWSVAWTDPWVSRAMSQLSTVPMASSPASARSLSSGRLRKEPGEFGTRKIRIQEETRAGPNLRLQPLIPQLSADGGRSPVLPNDGPMDRLKGYPVPENYRLPLVRNPDPSTKASFPASARAWRDTPLVTVQISRASCSTHPGSGKCWVNSE